MTDLIKGILNQAVSAIRNKDFKKAEIHCEKVISLNPTIGDAYNLLSLIHSEQKDFVKAITDGRKAILCSPNNIIFQNNLGKLFLSAGKEKEAISTFEKIITTHPQFFQAHFNLGKYHKKINDLEKAQTYFRNAIKINPEFVPALNNLANILQFEKKWDEASELYNKALSISPEFPEIHLNIGHIHAIKKEFEFAELSFHKSIQLKPTYWEAHLALANVYSQNKQYTKAEKKYLDVLAINEVHIESLLQLAINYKRNGDLAKSIQLFLRIISIDSTNIPAHVNLGLAYYFITDHENAKKHFLKALELDLSNPESRFALGKLYELEKKHLESKELYESLLKEEHSFNIQVLYELFLLNMRIADWNNYDELLKKIIEMTGNYITDDEQTFNVTPLTLNYFPVPNKLHLGVSKKYATLVSSEVLESKKTAAFTYPKKTNEGKLRIGYLSPDFRLHAVGLLLKDLFRFHNPNNVEIYLYAIVNIDDEYNASFKSSCNQYRDISRLSHLEAATLINQDQVNVLVDLAGYTSHCRPQILAYKPAPLQVSFLGYPNTSGSNYIDYIIGDKWLLPESLKSFYTEKFIHLPHSFVCSPLLIAKTIPSKLELGIPEDAFVFCCFNSIYKISPNVFATWMHILQATPKSILWLSKENDFVAENLKKVATQYGIDPKRLVFATRLPMDEYLASYQYADIFLDTFYYSAGSTAACALHAGVPIITLAGETNSSRMGASIVDAAGLSTFIVETIELYIQKAIHYYEHPTECFAAKEYLLAKRKELKLFDLETFAYNLESKLLELAQEID